MQGSMKGRIAVPLLSALVATSAFAMPRPGGQQAAGQFPRGYVSARGGYAGGRGVGGFGRSGYAVPRGYTGGYSPGLSGAQARHPRAGYGTGYSRGYGYGYGHGHGYGYGYGHAYYGHGRYPYYGHYYGHYPYYGYYPYYSRYPYYGAYGYYPWGGLGVGLGFYYGGGYPPPYYAGGYPAPYDSYSGGPSAGARNDEAYDGYSDRGERLEGEPSSTAELQLYVTPDDASVWVDDEFRGPARRLSHLALRPGRHHIEVVRPGFRAEAREVDVRAGADNSVRIDLEHS